MKHHSYSNLLTAHWLSFCLLLLPFPALSSTPTASFDRYSVILTRMPFGDEATAAKLAASAAVVNQPPAESFTKNLKMCAITRNHLSGKIQVGFVNTTTRKNYFLHEGDSEDGLELVRADYENEKALLKKNSEEVWLDMTTATATTPVSAFGGLRGMQIVPPSQVAPPTLSTTASFNSAGHADNSGDSPASRTLGAAFQRKLGQRQVERTSSRESSEMPSPAPVGAGGLGWVNNSPAVASAAKDQPATASSAALALTRSVASALEAVETTPTPEPAPTQVAAIPGSASVNNPVNNDVRVMDDTSDAPQLTAAYLQKQLEKIQMDRIRAQAQGQNDTLLPIALTPSMDAQLVSEFVLPPIAH